jgi:uncharacterized protein YkwD
MIRIIFAAKCVFSVVFIALALFSTDARAAVSSQVKPKSGFIGKFNSGINIENDERRVFELVNRERKKNGLFPLEWNSSLAQLARNYSEQMANERFFSHFDRNGLSLEDRVELMRIKGWRKIGENLFVCSGTNDFTGLAVQKWMKSPTHKRNILDSDWTTAGIGVAVSVAGEIYVTQVFMRN